MDTISPTPERISKGGLVQPVHSQTEHRSYYRHESTFERLGRKGIIDGDQVAAGNKLQKHWEGAQGVDVRETEGDSGNADVECPTTYHGQKVSEAKAALPPRQWDALRMIVDGTDELYAIGGAVLMRKDRAQATAGATVLVQEGLSVLVDLWGLKAGRRRHPPSR